MSPLVHGIHHITAIASDPQATVHFYTHVLGLRLVKKTVNQDDVGTYHLFFGDRTGEPGMDLTFFTFQPAFAGNRGVGQVTVISLAAPQESLPFWQQRFKKNKVRQKKIATRFGRERLIFYDADNQKLELVGVAASELEVTNSQPWTTGEVSEQVAIHCFYSAEMCVANIALIEPILTQVLDYTVSGFENKETCFENKKSQRAKYLEISTSREEIGWTGAGTVHHIAFKVDSETELLAARKKVLALGLRATEVVNRYYFKSVYFRTPAGILFELATAGPGFTADEKESELGSKLALPPFLESQRAAIEKHLVPLSNY